MPSVYADGEFTAEDNESKVDCLLQTYSKKNRSHGIRSGKTKSGRYKPRFEMEDLYIYKERIYFNSEGGKKCLDFVGSF